MLKKNIQIIKTHPVFIFRKLLKRVANLFKSGKARQCEINLGRVLDCTGNEKFENEKLLTERCNRPLTGIRRGWFSRVAPGGCCSVGRVNNPVKLEWFMLIRVKLLCCPHKRSVDLLLFFSKIEPSWMIRTARNCVKKSRDQKQNSHNFHVASESNAIYCYKFYHTFLYVYHVQSTIVIIYNKGHIRIFKYSKKKKNISKKEIVKLLL